MAKDDYQWWQNRLKTLSRYFDAFRIDHILGFFRIWQIPYAQVEGIMGYFNPAIPVHISEFEERGIPFEYDRFCQPYITDELLAELFGAEATYVKKTFLKKTTADQWQFKEAFNTQRKVADFFKKQKSKAQLQPLIFQLHSNILFISPPDSNGQFFHPRIDFKKTASFQQLGALVQHQFAGIVY